MLEMDAVERKIRLTGVIGEGHAWSNWLNLTQTKAGCLALKRIPIKKADRGIGQPLQFFENLRKGGLKTAESTSSSDGCNKANDFR